VVYDGAMAMGSRCLGRCAETSRAMSALSKFEHGNRDAQLLGFGEKFFAPILTLSRASGTEQQHVQSWLQSTCWWEESSICTVHSCQVRISIGF